MAHLDKIVYIPKKVGVTNLRNLLVLSHFLLEIHLLPFQKKNINTRTQLILVGITQPPRE